ncbi:hypothetical protein E3N88_36515 [Mikania micrantha]|uniref:Uncharacterized protein n=1 Tax=Mikania micrantha TaxID=192012 RepID=A0A5N6M3Z3_9ASTR|nr:hypothetical protein E3N88_36515 [Mikania micrantha]
MTKETRQQVHIGFDNGGGCDGQWFKVRGRLMAHDEEEPLAGVPRTAPHHSRYLAKDCKERNKTVALCTIGYSELDSGDIEDSYASDLDAFETTKTDESDNYNSY